MKELLLNDEILLRLLSGATYGSSWFGILLLKSEDYMDSGKEFECIEDIWVHRLLSGGHLLFTDDYESDDVDKFFHKISLEDIRRGLEIARDGEYREEYDALIDEEEDYEVCDTLVQIIMFGEVVYG